MKGKLIGIDPGFTATGLVLAYPKERGIKVIRHSVFGAEGENWYEKCDDIARRIREWILHNTEEYDLIYTMVEEPMNMLQSRAWSAALQNRLLSLIIDRVTGIGGDYNRTIKCSILHPMTMKKLFTGNGRAKKPQIIEVANSIYDLTKIKPVLKKETVADAIGITWCCWLYNRSGDEDMTGVASI